MGGLAMGLLALLRELLPFFKESVLQGRSFSEWFGSNRVTFGWLVSTIVLTICIFQVSEQYMILEARHQRLVRHTESLVVPIQKMTERYLEVVAEKTQLTAANQELLEENELLLARIEELETARSRRPRVVVRREAPAAEEPPRQSRFREIRARVVNRLKEIIN